MSLRAFIEKFSSFAGTKCLPSDSVSTYEDPEKAVAEPMAATRTAAESFMMFSSRPFEL